MSSTEFESEEIAAFGAPSHSTKRSSLKLRPSVLSSPAHVMNMNPSNSNLPWSSCEMPWIMQSNTGGVVEFHGGQINNQTLLSKRKAEDDAVEIKPKKLITEEKMAEHLRGLHISPDFTSHSKSSFEDCSNDSVSMESDASSSATDLSFTIPSTQDIEQKLRNAQRITICEQIRKIQNEPVIPQAILSRFERPCTALVLWQPPQKIIELRESLENYRKRDNEEEQDNNNSSSIDLNNSMELDM